MMLAPKLLTFYGPPKVSKQPFQEKKKGPRKKCHLEAIADDEGH